MSNKNDIATKYNSILIDYIKNTNEQYNTLKQINEEINPTPKNTVKIGLFL